MKSRFMISFFFLFLKKKNFVTRKSGENDIFPPKNDFQNEKKSIFHVLPKFHSQGMKNLDRQ